VKPAPFEYAAPRSLDEALDLLARHGGDAKILAGGQSLVPVLNFRLAQPALLVDVNRVPGLDAISATADGGLSIGALVRHRALERSAEVARRAPLLAEAVPFVAHPQIRTRGTFGGSLAHADPAAELPAVAVALGARLRLRRAGGERQLAAEDFFTGLFSTALEPEEMVVGVELPPVPPGSGFAFLEVARRHGDYAQAGVAASVTLDGGGRCRVARLVFVALGEGPVDASAIAAALVGEPPSEARCDDVARRAAEEAIDPLGDIHATAEFKRHLARVLARRALVAAASRATA